MSRIPQGKAQVQDSQLPVLRCDHELENESSGKGPGHRSEGEGGMTLGVCLGGGDLGAGARTKRKGHGGMGYRHLTNIGTHIIISPWSSEFILSQMRF